MNDPDRSADAPPPGFSTGDPSAEVEADFEAGDSTSIAATPQDFTRTVQLIDRYRAGDAAALERLIERYVRRVRVVVRARLPRAYQAVFDVDDVVQRTFVQAVKGLERFEHRSEGAFMRWITTIAINECRAVHAWFQARKRGEGVQPHLESMLLRRGGGDGSVAFDPEASIAPPVDAAARREVLDEVVDCLHELTERHREVILQRDYNGLSWREVAEALDLPSEGAATMLHVRARVALGRSLRRRGVSL